MDAHNGDTCAFYFKTTEAGVDSNRGRADYVGAGDETSASCYCGSCNEHLALCADGTTTVTVSPGSNFVMYWTTMNGVRVKTVRRSPSPAAAQPC